MDCVQKNEPTLARCIFVKHGLILIILAKQHQHTFEDYMHILLFAYLHFYLLYLLLNSCDGNDSTPATLSSASLTHCELAKHHNVLNEAVGQYKNREGERTSL